MSHHHRTKALIRSLAGLVLGSTVLAGIGATSAHAAPAVTPATSTSLATPSFDLPLPSWGDIEYTVAFYAGVAAYVSVNGSLEGIDYADIAESAQAFVNAN